VTKFGLVFLVMLGASGAWGIVRGGVTHRERQHPSVARNERLTALTGAILYVLLVAIVATVLDISGLLPEHYLVGFLVIPPVGLKMGSTGYRLARYYAGDDRYRLAGAPRFVLRFVVAPVLVGSTLAVLVTGVELWLFGLRFGDGWMAAHTITAVVMLSAVAVHILAHMRRSAESVRDLAAPTREALSGRSLVVGSLLVGAVLAVASLLYSSPFPPSAAGG
jgi:hypothetical protein